MGFDTASLRSAVTQMNDGPDNLVVIGETHVVKPTFVTEYLIIKELAPRGYRTIFIEGGESDAQILNAFMQTGDTSLLKYTRASEPSGTYMNLLKSLYSLNKANNYRFTFDAFDFERANRLHFLFSRWFDPAKVSDQGLRDQITKLLAIPDLPVHGLPVQSKELKSVFEEVKQSFPRYEAEYRELLGADFQHFRSIIFNPVFSDFASRDARMCETVLAKAKDHGLGKSILIMGSQHIVEKDKFIPLLSAGLPENYSFTCIVFAYSNCSTMTGGGPMNSKKSLLKSMGADEVHTSLIKFMKAEPSIVPSGRKNISCLIAGFYNQ